MMTAGYLSAGRRWLFGAVALAMLFFAAASPPLHAQAPKDTKWVLMKGYPKVSAGKEVKYDASGSMSVDHTFNRTPNGPVVNMERALFNLRFTPPPAEIETGKKYVLTLSGNTPPAPLVGSAGRARWKWDQRAQSSDHGEITGFIDPKRPAAQQMPKNSAFDFGPYGIGQTGAEFSLFLYASASSRAEHYMIIEWRWTWGSRPVQIDLLDANPLFSTNQSGARGRESAAGPTGRSLLGTENPLLNEARELGKEPNFVGPRFPKAQLPFKKSPSPDDDLVLVTMETKRVGAATDGSSLLLVRARLPAKGTVVFSLSGEGESGSLHPLVGSPFGRGPGRTLLSTPTRKITHPGGVAADYAFCLYRPPDLTWGGGASHRAVEIKVALKPDSGDPVSGAETIKLIRPPVLLVHGTYDEPIGCYKVGFKLPDGRVLPSMTERLREHGFSVFLLNWKKTNGAANPSDFATNERTVFDSLDDPWTEEQLRQASFERIEQGGIRDALTFYRRQGFAATQADLVCHSQGGVITRVFIKGVRSSTPRPLDDVHYTNPEKCTNCWYHNDPAWPSFHRGSVRRVVTISTTHRGSDLCRILMAFQGVAEPHAVLGGKMSPPVAIWTNLFLLGADNMQGLYTGGFRDQIPSSTALRAIGATPVRAHAIACIADDEDMMTVLEDGTFLDAAARAKAAKPYPVGYYQARLELIWNSINPTVMKQAFAYLGQTKDGEDLAQRRISQTELESQATSFSPSAAANSASIVEHRKLHNPRLLRRAVFAVEDGRYEPNDCTVNETSSLGGLKPPFATTVPHALHSWAPRYKEVQDLVVSLLTDGRDRFAPGFPNTYDKQPAEDVKAPGRGQPPAWAAPTPTAAGTQPMERATPALRPIAGGDSQAKGPPLFSRTDAGVFDAGPAVQGPITVAPAVTEDRRGEQRPAGPVPTAPGAPAPRRVAPPSAGSGTALDLERGVDSRNWSVSAAGGATQRVERGELRCAMSTGASGSVEAWSRTPLRGDFIVAFQCLPEDWQPRPGDSLELELKAASATGAASPEVVIRRRIDTRRSGNAEFLAGGARQVFAQSGPETIVGLQRRGQAWSLLTFDPASGVWRTGAALKVDVPGEIFLGVSLRKAGAASATAAINLGSGASFGIELK